MIVIPRLYVILLSAFIALLISCTSSVRFSSDKNDDTPKKEQKSGKSGFSRQDENNKYHNLNNLQQKIIEEAKKLIGTPYCYGGEDESCTDCSGFTQQVFKKINISLPRTSDEQYQFGKIITDNEAQPADLVFFREGSRISHVGIYLGNRNFIHASSSKGVIIQDLNLEYYMLRIAGFRRVIK